MMQDARPTKRQTLYRNVKAGDLLETFFLSAVTSLLGLRFYLYLTGFPTVGGAKYHIAHMLWGGMLMLIAIVLALSFLGRRVQRLTALFGGVGFGIFIDELGKFITRDNNYFFKPTIGLLYAIFVILYLTFNFLGRRQKLTSREYQLNALAQLEEAVVQDLDKHEKARVLALLDQADATAHAGGHKAKADTSTLTKLLRQYLESVGTVPLAKPGPVGRFRSWLDHAYERFWHARRSNGLVQAFFAFEAACFLAGVLFALYTNIDNLASIIHGWRSYANVLVVGEFVSVLVAAAHVAVGLLKLPSSRRDGFEWFRRATLINLFLTEFFVFSRQQFAAMPGFAFNLLLLGLINLVLSQERRARD